MLFSIYCLIVSPIIPSRPHSFRTRLRLHTRLWGLVMSANPSMELCSACNRFVQDNYRECKHHGTLRALKNCAETKTTPSCALCCLLWTGVQAQYSVSVSMSNVGSILASDYTLDLGYTRQGHLRWMYAKGTVMSDGTRPILGTLDIISEQGRHNTALVYNHGVCNDFCIPSTNLIMGPDKV